MEDLRPFIGQLVRLVLMVAGILAGREVLIRLPMVAELQDVPGLGVSAYQLITAIAFVAVLGVLMAFVKHIEAMAGNAPGSFPWQALITQLLILLALVVAYPTLAPFARSLLGAERYWIYAASLLVLTAVPVVSIGRLLYEFLSQRIERWEA